IAVRWRGDWVELELRDNGGGTPESPPAQSPSASETAGGFGLRSLSERARELGGSFIVQHDEEGVVLVGSIPVGSAG
ncbi:MAG: hypothetical protein Q4G46_11825, partial [Propionibacteriaceae bacterium]|nr:hypothetical protein [Propionibacteriaceae bacterium]